MPLLRLPKIRSHKEAKSSEGGGDTGSLASGRHPSVTSLKSLGNTSEWLYMCVCVAAAAYLLFIGRF